MTSFEALHKVRLFEGFAFFDDGLRAVALEFCENTSSVIDVSDSFRQSLLEAVRCDLELYLLVGKGVVDPCFNLPHVALKVALMSSTQTREGPLARTTTFHFVLAVLADFIALS